MRSCDQIRPISVRLRGSASTRALLVCEARASLSCALGRRDPTSAGADFGLHHLLQIELQSRQLQF